MGLPMLKKLLFLVPALLLLSDSEAKEVSVLVPGEPGQQQLHSSPFENGEKVSYRGSWNGIPLTAVDIRTSSLWLDGKKAFQVDVDARTQKGPDFLWRMRDSVQSVFEAGTFWPRQFVLRQRENSRSTDTNAFYDQIEKKWTVSRLREKESSRFEIDSGNTFDVITATYLVRSVDFKVGDQLRFYTLGAKNLYLVTLEVVGLEAITTHLGTLDAYRIIAQAQNLNKSRRAHRTRQATVWISADSRRLPLKLQSQSFFGSVYLEIVKSEGSQGASLQEHATVSFHRPIS
jgi:Protein of unknown function (DUF3108)